MTELLYFQPFAEPQVKRVRLNDVDIEMVDFQVNFRVWLGRRSSRRAVARENAMLNAWDIEKSVSLVTHLFF